MATKPIEGPFVVQAFGKTRLRLDPSLKDKPGTTAYTFDTHNVLVESDLAEWSNRGDTAFKIVAETGWTGSGAKVFTDNGTFQTLVTFDTFLNTTTLKSTPSDSRRKLVFIEEPDYGEASFYHYKHGDTTAARGGVVLVPNDGLGRYFKVNP